MSELPIAFIIWLFFVLGLLIGVYIQKTTKVLK
jgi:uncharacterized protein YneF (UPF0154 family)